MPAASRRYSRTCGAGAGRGGGRRCRPPRHRRPHGPEGRHALPRPAPAPGDRRDHRPPPARAAAGRTGVRPRSRGARRSGANAATAARGGDDRDRLLSHPERARGLLDPHARPARRPPGRSAGFGWTGRRQRGGRAIAPRPVRRTPGAAVEGRAGCFRTHPRWPQRTFSVSRRRGRARRSPAAHPGRGRRRSRIRRRAGRTAGGLHERNPAESRGPMNPELRRNLWLQFSPGRLLLAPICLGLVLVSVWIVAFHVYNVVALLSEATYYLLAVL